MGRTKQKRKRKEIHVLTLWVGLWELTAAGYQISKWKKRCHKKEGEENKKKCIADSVY